MRNFWCEIYLDKIESNLELIKNTIKGKKLIAVVKGNAYGLGMKDITHFLNDKIDMFAVSDIMEAEKIVGDKPILLLPPLNTYKDFNSKLPNLVHTLCDEDILKYIDKQKKIKVHIYIDTGMNRMGIKPHRLDMFIEKIRKEFPNITIDGLYTHLHNVGNKKYTLKQIVSFEKCVEKYKDEVSYIHCLNSGGVLDMDYVNYSQFSNAVRVGNIIYGYSGFHQGFKKSYTFFAKPVNKYFVKKGEYVGYGCRFKAKRDMYIGILDFGAIQHFGFYRYIKKNIFYEILRIIYNHFKGRPVIFNGTAFVPILNGSDMNSTIIDLTNCSADSLLRVELSPILADSSVDRFYISSCKG